MHRIKIKKLFLSLLISAVAAGFIYGWHQYRILTAVPTTRLAAGGYYPDMPPDDHRRYIQLPIDHSDPSMGTFTVFYYLSPNFKPGDNVIFWLCDNQQELVGMLSKPEDFDYFEESLGGLSYVLIGNRGVSPTLFPEVFNRDGAVNYQLAVKLYGSEQQIDDIEAVRQDMQANNLLRQDGKIMLYGGSGGGFLEQQYLDKYGSNVSRTLVEFSGAPDLAQQHNVSLARTFYDANPEAAQTYFTLSQKGPRLSFAYTLFKLGQAGEKELQTSIAEGQARNTAFKEKYLYLKNWINPANNFLLVNFILGVPSELEVKVRMYEILGADLQNYQPASPQQVVLMYEWTRLVLADFLKVNAAGKIPTPEFTLNRASHTGEVMVWSGAEDQVFSPQMGYWISSSYPCSKLAVFDDAHNRQKYPDYYRGFRKSFFTTGLNSPETQNYFNDARQLNGK